ncbi:hypothetical protein D9M71_576550 [compost metagenome]
MAPADKVPGRRKQQSWRITVVHGRLQLRGQERVQVGQHYPLDISLAEAKCLQAVEQALPIGLATTGA